MTDDNVTRLHCRVITLKTASRSRFRTMPRDAPSRMVFSHVIGSLKGALVYEISGRRYIAIQDEPDNG